MKIRDVIQQEPLSSRTELANFFERFPENAEVYIKKIPPGSYLVREGEPCLYIYCILKGKVTAQYHLGNNAFVAKNFGRLRVIGDIAAMGNLKYYSTSIQALTACNALEVRIRDYWNWLLADQTVLRNQLEDAFGLLLDELRKKRELEEGSSEMRLLSYFAVYCRKANLNKDHPQDVIIVKKTREKIVAEMGGISIRTVNRKIALLAEKKLITITHGKIQISSRQLQKIEEIIEDAFDNV